MTTTARTVTGAGGKTYLLIQDKRDQIPTTFALMATRAGEKVCLRISGGCKGMDGDDKRAMIGFFLMALEGFKGMIWSGGTRQFDKDIVLDPMVTDIPGFIAASNPECVALGSAPRTDVLRLTGESHLMLDDYGTAPNPAMNAILLVQDGAEGKLDWDGDLNAAFELMSNLKTHAGFKQVGVIAWNGGDITRDEIMRSINMGWPTFVIKGSGRAADKIATELEAGTLKVKQGNLIVVDKNDPINLRQMLITFGFIQNI
jgi:hypothetical protein